MATNRREPRSVPAVRNTISAAMFAAVSRDGTRAMKLQENPERSAASAFGSDRRKEVAMKLSVLTIAALMTVGTVASAGAVEFGVGPGGAYVGPDRHRTYERDYRGGDCRTVIKERTNRFGERVTVRDRVCD
jgi:hypothetical protein